MYKILPHNQAYSLVWGWSPSKENNSIVYPCSWFQDIQRTSSRSGSDSTTSAETFWSHFHCSLTISSTSVKIDCIWRWVFKLFPSSPLNLLGKFVYKGWGQPRLMHFSPDCVQYFSLMLFIFLFCLHMYIHFI